MADRAVSGINPTEDDIGREVVYRPHHARDVSQSSEWEYGRITSFNDSGVFVLYHTRAGGRRNTGTTAEHTNRSDLWWPKP